MGKDEQVQDKSSLDLSVIIPVGCCTFYSLRVGVIRLLFYLHLVSYRFCIDISDIKWIKYLVSYPFCFCWYLPSLLISTVKFQTEGVTHFLNC